MKNFLQKIFSIKIVNSHLVYKVFGIKIKFKLNEFKSEVIPNVLPEPNANAEPQPINFSVFDYTNAFIMEYFLDKQFQKYENANFELSNFLKNSKSILLSTYNEYLERTHGYYKYFFDGQVYPLDTLPSDNKGADLYVLISGIGSTIPQRDLIVESLINNKPVLISESTFISSINSFCDDNTEPKYRYNIGIVLDYLTAYYDGTRQSYLEKMLNDKCLIISDEQKLRARKCIDKIIQNHLTKYNSQPIFEPKIGREGVKKVLVVDQSYGDNSIKKGCASTITFETMLKKAIDENPDADIIVKTHPDTMSGNRGGYYTGLKQHDNIYPMTEPINPISLVKYCDKVYVCTTQLGFEALMCGKEVHVFGIPFYQGWGVTIDEQKCERRTNKRTLEEIFYITYIMYSHYVNPEKRCRCEIEEAMDYLLKLRDEYFERMKVRENGNQKL